MKVRERKKKAKKENIKAKKREGDENAKEG
jgi:hypothetical protein